MKHIELINQENHFGFPACVYKFNKHETLKDELYEESTLDLTPSKFNSYMRTNPYEKPIFDRGLPAMNSLREAFEEALNHFYYDVLDAVKDYQPYTRSATKPILTAPKITQSWAVHTRPINDNHYANHMNMHTHWLSPVCGSYYLKKPKELMGGNLVFANPVFHECMGCQHDSIHMLRDALMCNGIQRISICEVEEGNIVLWAGALPHTIEKIKDSTIERVSIIINSLPSSVVKRYEAPYLYEVNSLSPNAE